MKFISSVYEMTPRKPSVKKPAHKKKAAKNIASQYMHKVRRFLTSKGIRFSRKCPCKQEIANAILSYKKIDITIDRQEDANNIIAEFSREIPRTNISSVKRANKRRYQERQSFYTSDEWRALRYEALKIYGRKCLVCGATPELGAVLHVDHVKPRSLYPELELSLANLQILCADCNLGKSNKDSIDYRQHYPKTE